MPVSNPRANGAVESTNGNVFNAVSKAVVGLAKGKWVEVLPSVLWSIRTMVTRPTGFSPFRLLYGVEAVTSKEVQVGSFQMTHPLADDQDVSKDLLEEMLLQEVTHLQKCMASTKKHTPSVSY